MTYKERFEKENEAIIEIIEAGQFLTAKEGMQIGKWISEGFMKGISENKEIKINIDRK